MDLLFDPDSWTFCDECSLDIDLPDINYCPYCGGSLGLVPLTMIFPAE